MEKFKIIMKTIEIKTVSGAFLFSHTSENNTIKTTVDEAVKRGVSLRKADFRNQDLSGIKISSKELKNPYFFTADYCGGDFKGSDFIGANLRGVDLSFSNLKNVDFSGANLKFTDLKNACSVGACFSGVKVNKHTKF